MTKLTVEAYEDVIAVINKIKSINDTGIELEIPDGSLLFENILNLKLLEKAATREGKKLHFQTPDETGQVLLDMLDEGGIASFPSGDIGDFGFSEDSGGESGRIPLTVRLRGILPKITLPKVKIKGTLPFVLLSVLGIVFLGGYFAIKSRKADVKIVVNAQPLARSVTLRLIKDGATDQIQKTLRGYEVTGVLSESMEKDTTGERIVGEKADGKILIFNKTNAPIELSDGTQVAYKGTSTDLFYVLKDDVTVPSLAPQDPSDPASPLIPGEVEVEVIASEFGEDYNIDGDETLEFEEYKKSELEGKTSGDISGGKSELINMVAQEDVDSLAQELFEQLSSRADEILEGQVGKSRRYISGSSSVSISGEEYDREVGDEAKKLKLTQTLNVVGLSYDEDELDNFLEELMGEFVPDEFELSDKDKKVSVEVLGNTDSSVLSFSEADIQVTVKAYVVPTVDEKHIKEELSGVSVEDAKRVLGSVSNVKTYELNISPGMPFFQKVPADKDRISVEVVRE